VIFHWSPQARAELRGIDRANAIEILHALTRFGQTGAGDLSALQGPLSGALRLRVGDWRVRFRRLNAAELLILSVRHRSKAYR
jgi:mRNA-degrading endonuclease RelE of RelBE toxin-antitoxin system